MTNCLNMIDQENQETFVTDQRFITDQKILMISYTHLFNNAVITVGKYVYI